jgi:hypothetical protein
MSDDSSENDSSDQSEDNRDEDDGLEGVAHRGTRWSSVDLGAGLIGLWLGRPLATSLHLLPQSFVLLCLL